MDVFRSIRTLRLVESWSDDKRWMFNCTYYVCLIASCFELIYFYSSFSGGVNSIFIEMLVGLQLISFVCILGCLYDMQFCKVFTTPGGMKLSKLYLAKCRMLSDLQLYKILSVSSRICCQYSDTASVFIMGPGFFIDVACNYVVAMLYGKIPLLLYLLVAVVDIVAHTIIMVEVPQCSQLHSRSTDLIKYWKRGANKRRSIRQKSVNSFRPAGVRVGPFFAMTEETFFSYVHQILNKTVDFILLL